MVKGVGGVCVWGGGEGAGEEGWGDKGRTNKGLGSKVGEFVNPTRAKQHPPPPPLSAQSRHSLPRRHVPLGEAGTGLVVGSAPLVQVVNTLGHRLAVLHSVKMVGAAQQGDDRGRIHGAVVSEPLP